MHPAYVAGIIDGEGCIQLTRTRTTYFPRVLVTNTNLALLEALKKEFGGDIKPLHARRDGWKAGYTWRISWAKAVDLLELVSPWLRVKLQQAHTVFAWDAIKPGRGVRWDAEALDLLRRRITWLNQRGPASGPDPIDEVVGEAHAAR